jgi:hypothetical protein
MKVVKLTLIAGMTFLLSAGVAYGQSQAYGTDDPGLEQRMENQEQRIQQGINSGQLTPREAGRLEAQEAKIKQDELRMKSDGNLSSAERQKLNRELDKASSDIYREKHDAQHVNVGQGSSQGTNHAGNVNDSGIEKRMQNQQQRIRQGINSGQLTPKEAGRLKTQQAKIKQDELRMKSDGKLTSAERKKLNRELDREDKRIHKEKHNHQHVSTK